MKRYFKWALKIPFVKKILDTISKKDRVEGKEFALGLPFMDYLYEGPVIYHTVAFEEAGRLDLIAWKYYDDPYLWEIIAYYNEVYDPIAGVKAGDTLIIPQRTPNSPSNFYPRTYQGITY